MFAMHEPDLQDEDSDAVHQISAQPSKRRRVNMACHLCRTRKIRCDGLRPKCSACKPGRDECVYQPASQMVNVSRAYISKLKDRAAGADQNLPSAKAAKKNSRAQDTATQSIQKGASTNQQAAMESQKLSGAWSRSNNLQEERSSEPSTTSPAWQSSERMRPGRRSLTEVLEIERPTPEDNGPALPPRTGPTASLDAIDQDYFCGDSSTMSYIQDVQMSLASGPSPSSSSMTYTLGNKPGSDSNTGNISLLQPGLRGTRLSRPMADELITSYFRYVHLLYPFLHRPSFQAQYERTWNSTDGQDDEWLALVNVVLALGCRFSQLSANETTASDKLFNCTRSMVSTENLALPTLQTLQLLLLQALYFQFTNRTNENWNTVGLAIRVATTMGIHVDPSPGQYNAITIELRRRCWYGCVVLDIVLALNLGRPTSIPDNFNVSAPSSLDDEYITPQGYAQQPRRPRSKTAFFVQLVPFCNIMKDVQCSLYPQTSRYKSVADGNKRLTRPSFSEAVRLDQSLLEWYQAVPEFLKFSHPDDDNTFDWIRNVLLSRFLNLRILIHRRFASKWRTQHQYGDPSQMCVEPIDDFLHSTSVELCRSAAVRLIGAISDNFVNGFPGAWWAEMNYLFTAGSVLLAIENTNRGPQLEAASQAAFDRSLEILQRMQDTSSMAATYATKLEKIRESRLAAEKAVESQPMSTTKPATKLSGDQPLNPNSDAANLNDYLTSPLPLESFSFGWDLQDQSHASWDYLLEDNFMPWT